MSSTCLPACASLCLCRELINFCKEPTYITQKNDSSDFELEKEVCVCVRVYVVCNSISEEVFSEDNTEAVEGREADSSNAAGLFSQHCLLANQQVYAPTF